MLQDYLRLTRESVKLVGHRFSADKPLLSLVMSTFVETTHRNHHRIHHRNHLLHREALLRRQSSYHERTNMQFTIVLLLAAIMTVAFARPIVDSESPYYGPAKDELIQHKQPTTSSRRIRLLNEL